MSLVDLQGRTDEPEVAALLGLVATPPEHSVAIGWLEGDELVACAVVKRHSPDAIELVSVAVGEDRRGHGVGRSLVDAVCDVATAQRVVSAPHPFLARCGFEPAGKSSLVRGLVDAPAAESRPWTLSRIERAIRSAWSRETSSVPGEWSEENPSLGHCDVTSTFVRELLGGEIVIANVLLDGRRVGRHAWNRLAGGGTLDLTREQFLAGETFGQGTVQEPIVLQRLPERYARFSERVRAQLQRESTLPPS